MSALPVKWLGTAEDCEAVRQFARDYPWEGRVEDADYAAGEVLGALEVDGELHPEMRAMLLGELTASAERWWQS